MRVFSKKFFLGFASLAIVGGALASPIAKRRLEVELWHRLGKDGQSCSSCHTPSGREVWDSSISPEDIVRRAKNHLSETEATALSTEVELERSTQKLHGTDRRPFEPGKVTLKNDADFGKSLEKVCPLLSNGEVYTLEQANKAARELCSTPLTDVSAGLVFDPISRDIVRQLDGPAMGDWIPDTALSQAGTDAFEKACSKYVSPDGTYDLEAIDSEVCSVEGDPKTGIQALSRYKRLALLKYESYLNTGKIPKPMKLNQRMIVDPIWAVADIARLSDGKTPELLGIDDAMAKRIGVNLGEPLKLNQMALSWMWISWTLDPSLQHVSLERKATMGQYFSKLLWDEGPYPWHGAYFAARRPIEQKFEAAETFALQPEISSFVNHDVLLEKAPKTSEYAKFCANMLRMDCLILEDDLKHGKKLVHREAARQQLSTLWKFVKQHVEKSELDKTGAIVDRVVEALNKL